MNNEFINFYKHKLYNIVSGLITVNQKIIQSSSGYIKKDEGTITNIIEFPTLSLGNSQIDGETQVKYTNINTIDKFVIIDYYKNIIEPLNIFININQKQTRIEFNKNFNEDVSKWKIIIYGVVGENPQSVYIENALLNDLGDVSFSELSGNQYLKYDGTNWINTSLSKVYNETITDSTVVLNYLDGDVRNLTNNTANSKTLLITNIPIGQGMYVRIFNNGMYPINFKNQSIISTSGNFAVSFINSTGTIEMLGEAINIK